MDSQHTRLPAHPARLHGPQIPGSQHLQACKQQWRPKEKLCLEPVSSSGPRECMEAATLNSFSTSLQVLGGQAFFNHCAGSPTSGYHCGNWCWVPDGSPKPDIILTFVHTNSKPCLQEIVQVAIRNGGPRHQIQLDINIIPYTVIKYSSNINPLWSFEEPQLLKLLNLQDLLIQ